MSASQNDIENQTDVIASVQAAIGSGDLFTAYDQAMAAVDSGDAAPRLRYLAVLALARMGATRRAHALYQKLDLGADPSTDAQALEARLLKDLAFVGQGDCRAAADRYFAIYEASGDYFPGINAATLYFLSGDQLRGQQIAEQLLQSADLINDAGYYGAATRAEALLLLARDEDAAAVLADSVALAGDDLGSIATTRLQLLRIADARGLDAMGGDQVLSALAPKKVAHFCGHMVPPHMGADQAWQDELAAAFTLAVHDHDVGIVYGALASGADIVFAETALALGLSLVVVLPFRREDFIAESVAPAGADWVARFDACMARASSIAYAMEDEFVDDPWQFSYGSMMAMGLVRLRAQALEGDCLQIAAWDGAPTDYPAGTAKDVAMWQQAGGESVIIPFERTAAPDMASPNSAGDVVAEDTAVVDASNDGLGERVMCSIIFTDFHNFSKLPESKLPYFSKSVMGACADVVDAFDDAVTYRNTWGDALFLIIDDVATAAALALQLQQRIAQVDGGPLGLDDVAQMRVGLHYGPVYRVADPVTKRDNFYGSQISRTARIEPVTPPGAVYVTEAFAAILAMDHAAPFACSYVGKIDLPKGFGTFRMYHLESTGPAT